MPLCLDLHQNERTQSEKLIKLCHLDRKGEILSTYQ